MMKRALIAILLLAALAGLAQAGIMAQYWARSLVSGITATGGVMSNIVGYTCHIFTNSGTFAVASGSGNASLLIVAAGGGTPLAGNGVGGGGGGGVTSVATYAISPGSYTVTVGLGYSAANGSNSVFAGITAIGGGFGGNYNQAGSTGGSGGGAGRQDLQSRNGGTGVAGQGYAGGNATNSSGYCSAGGGGARDKPGMAAELMLSNTILGLLVVVGLAWYR